MIPHPAAFFASVFVVVLLLLLAFKAQPSSMTIKGHFLAEVFTAAAITLAVGICYGTARIQGWL